METLNTTSAKWKRFFMFIRRGQTRETLAGMRDLLSSTGNALLQVQRDINAIHGTKTAQELEARIKQEQLMVLQGVVTSFLRAPTEDLTSEQHSRLLRMVRRVRRTGFANENIGAIEKILEQIRKAERSLSHTGWGVIAKEVAAQELWRAYAEAKTLQARLIVVYTEEGRALKRLLPLDVYPWAEQFIELFIYGPLRLILDHLRINYPGPLGLFGLDGDELFGCGAGR